MPTMPEARCPRGPMPTRPEAHEARGPRPDARCQGARVPTMPVNFADYFRDYRLFAVRLIPHLDLLIH